MPAENKDLRIQMESVAKALGSEVEGNETEGFLMGIPVAARRTTDNLGVWVYEPSLRIFPSERRLQINVGPNTELNLNNLLTITTTRRRIVIAAEPDPRLQAELIISKKGVFTLKLQSAQPNS